jgi:predicted membrane metal-binding protein
VSQLAVARQRSAATSAATGVASSVNTQPRLLARPIAWVLGSTSAHGFGATASTSFSAATAGAWSPSAAASAGWRTASESTSRRPSTVEPRVKGELAGIVLGEDEGLSERLCDRFRASGLYHLLSW